MHWAQGQDLREGIMIDSGRYSDTDSAPLIAASIFLDALNVFRFFLRIFSRNN